jgi:hypothetical protein
MQTERWMYDDYAMPDSDLGEALTQRNRARAAFGQLSNAQHAWRAAVREAERLVRSMSADDVLTDEGAALAAQALARIHVLNARIAEADDELTRRGADASFAETQVEQLMSRRRELLAKLAEPVPLDERGMRMSTAEVDGLVRDLVRLTGKAG